VAPWANHAIVAGMTDDGLGSRSDLEALQRSGRGKVLTLLLILAVALGAAGWFFFLRKQGTGNKEDPAKILVVASSRGYSLVLADVGFEAHEGTFDAWQDKAKEEVPELDTTGIESIMTLADRFGYGYVVFEKPQEFDFSKLDIDGDVPPMPDHVQFAVLSAGDFAFPHVMTVNPKPSEVLRGSSVVILQALFEQERLKAALPENDGASIEAVQLRDQLRDAIDRLARIPEAERMAETIVGQVRRQLEEEERAERKPALVGRPLESGSPYALAHGQLLTITRGFQVVTRDAVRADLALDDVERLSIGAPGAEPDARSKCEALAGGEISVHESPRYWVAEDGAAVLVQTLGAGLQLFTLDPGQPGCAFTAKGKVAAASPGLGDPVLAGHGQVARVGSLAGQAVVSVVTAGQDDELVLGMLDYTELAEVAWLDERHLVAVGAGPEGPGVWIFDTQTPLRVRQLTGSVFENADTVHEVAVGKRGPRPVVVVTAGDMPRKLYRLDLPADLAELFNAPPIDAAAAATPAVDRDAVPDFAMPAEDREALGLPAIVALDPNRFVAVALTHEGSVRSPSLSLDGSRVAFELRGEAFDPTAPDDAEIASMPTGGKGEGLAVLTRNALRDEDPRLTPDGSHVVFHTRVEIPRTDWVVSAPRVVALGQ
jgi:hypothetical protein